MSTPKDTPPRRPHNLTLMLQEYCEGLAGWVRRGPSGQLPARAGLALVGLALAVPLYLAARVGAAALNLVGRKAGGRS